MAAESFVHLVSYDVEINGDIDALNSTFFVPPQAQIHPHAHPIVRIHPEGTFRCRFITSAETARPSEFSSSLQPAEWIVSGQLFCRDGMDAHVSSLYLTGNSRVEIRKDSLIIAEESIEIDGELAVHRGKILGKKKVVVGMTSRIILTSRIHFLRNHLSLAECNSGILLTFISRSFLGLHPESRGKFVIAGNSIEFGGNVFLDDASMHEVSRPHSPTSLSFLSLQLLHSPSLFITFQVGLELDTSLEDVELSTSKGYVVLYPTCNVTLAPKDSTNDSPSSLFSIKSFFTKVWAGAAILSDSTLFHSRYLEFEGRLETVVFQGTGVDWRFSSTSVLRLDRVMMNVLERIMMDGTLLVATAFFQVANAVKEEEYDDESFFGFRNTGLIHLTEESAFVVDARQVIIDGKLVFVDPTSPFYLHMESKEAIEFLSDVSSTFPGSITLKSANSSVLWRAPRLIHANNVTVMAQTRAELHAEELHVENLVDIQGQSLGVVVKTGKAGKLKLVADNGPQDDFSSTINLGGVETSRVHTKIPRTDVCLKDFSCLGTFHFHRCFILRSLSFSAAFPTHFLSISPSFVLHLESTLYCLECRSATFQGSVTLPNAVITSHSHITFSPETTFVCSDGCELKADSVISVLNRAQLTMTNGVIRAPFTSFLGSSIRSQKSLICEQSADIEGEVSAPSVSLGRPEGTRKRRGVPQIMSTRVVLNGKIHTDLLDIYGKSVTFGSGYSCEAYKEKISLLINVTELSSLPFAKFRNLVEVCTTVTSSLSLDVTDLPSSLRSLKLSSRETLSLFGETTATEASRETTYFFKGEKDLKSSADFACASVSFESEGEISHSGSIIADECTLSGGTLVVISGSISALQQKGKIVQHGKRCLTVTVPPRHGHGVIFTSSAQINTPRLVLRAPTFVTAGDIHLDFADLHTSRQIIVVPFPANAKVTSHSTVLRVTIDPPSSRESSPVSSSPDTTPRRAVESERSDNVTPLEGERAPRMRKSSPSIPSQSDSDQPTPSLHSSPSPSPPTSPSSSPSSSPSLSVKSRTRRFSASDETVKDKHGPSLPSPSLSLNQPSEKSVSGSSRRNGFEMKTISLLSSSPHARSINESVSTHSLDSLFSVLSSIPGIPPLPTLSSPLPSRPSSRSPTPPLPPSVPMERRKGLENDVTGAIRTEGAFTVDHLKMRGDVDVAAVIAENNFDVSDTESYSTRKDVTLDKMKIKKNASLSIDAKSLKVTRSQLNVGGLDLRTREGPLSLITSTVSSRATVNLNSASAMSLHHAQLTSQTESVIGHAKDSIDVVGGSTTANEDIAFPSTKGDFVSTAGKFTAGNSVYVAAADVKLLARQYFYPGAYASRLGVEGTQIVTGKGGVYVDASESLLLQCSVINAGDDVRLNGVKGIKDDIIQHTYLADIIVKKRKMRRLWRKVTHYVYRTDTFTSSTTSRNGRVSTVSAKGSVQLTVSLLSHLYLPPLPPPPSPPPFFFLSLPISS